MQRFIVAVSNPPRQMTTITTNNKDQKAVGSVHTLEESFELRQKDTGWGYAFASLLPFVHLYYGWTRRTITPLVADFAGSFVTAVFISIAVTSANPDLSDKQVKNLSQLAIFSSPVWVKLGINSARKQGAKKLQELN